MLENPPANTSPVSSRVNAVESAMVAKIVRWPFGEELVAKRYIEFKIVHTARRWFINRPRRDSCFKAATTVHRQAVQIDESTNPSQAITSVGEAFFAAARRIELILLKTLA